MRHRLLTVLVVSLVTLVAMPAPAHATTYWYMPSHPINWESPKPWPQRDCTGAWGIRLKGSNLPYFLTAGHCFFDGEVVYGTVGPIGHSAESSYYPFPSQLDTARVQPGSGVDGWQEIPGVGKVVGKVGADYLAVPGVGIAMKPVRAGVSYGTMEGGWNTWGDYPAMCGTYSTEDHDSGAPVFVHFGNQVYAAGVHVGSKLLPGGVYISCFIYIDDLLSWHQAELPTFPVGSQSPQLPAGFESSSKAKQLPVVGRGTPVVRRR